MNNRNRHTPPHLTVRHPLATESLMEGQEDPSPGAGIRNLLTAAEAAAELEISTTTLYDWLGQSDRGILVIRGQPVSIDYYQGGRAGQGRIRITAAEVERLLQLMRVIPHPKVTRRPAIRRQVFPGITVPLGLPDRLS